MKTWEIDLKLTGNPHTIYLVLHDSLEELRAEAHAFASKVGEDGLEADTFANAAAVSHPYTVDDGNEVATIRFARGNVNHVVIAHEALHAAMWLYRIDQLTDDDKAVDHVHGSNEALGYAHSSIQNAIIELMGEAGEL